MSRKPIASLIAILAFTLARPAAADDDAPKQAPAAAGATADEAAAQWMAKGNSAFKEGRFAEAEAAYREAWSLKKGYDIAGNLGAAELAQGKRKEAAQHLAFTLRTFPVTGQPALREQMAKAYEVCRAGVGAVRVTVEPRGATIRVDGEVFGEAPLADEVFVDPGEHAIEVAFAGYKSATRRVRVDAGGSTEITLTLAPIPAAPPPPPPPEAPPRRRNILPGLAIGAVSAVGIVGGISFMTMSAARRSEADTLRSTILSKHGSCVKGAGNYDASHCPQLQDKLISDDTFHDVAVGAFIAGGIAAAGTAAYFLWPSKRTDSAGHALRVTPLFGGDGGAVMVTGAF